VPSCPFCHLPLSEHEFASGKCRHCLKTFLPTGELPGPDEDRRNDQTLDSTSVPSVSSPGPKPGTVAERPFMQTFDSSAAKPETPEKEGKKTADERPFMQTFDSSAAKPETPGKAGRKTADQRRVDQTIDSTVGDAGTPEKAGRKTDDQRRVDQTLDSAVDTAALPKKKTADDRKVDQTIESAGASPPVEKKTARPAQTFDGMPPAEDVDQRVSMMWSGKVSSEATPHTSLKGITAELEGQASLAIQKRVLRRPDVVGSEMADYELMSTLGEGGMGIVLVARQASIDRLVAVKMLKPAGAGDPQARRKFLSEAAVTGDLEHPNIVPIYDLGADETGTLFYSMKRVKGTPWSKVIRKKTFQENIEILMKVADATAFAHSRDVIHRDLKPENVMLGDFGEVLLMDWGLAVLLRPGNAVAGMAGTPAYMAPEMAFGPSEKIGKASDIYLLGAILWEIITDDPPHGGDNVMACLGAAARNEIRPTTKTGELVAVALRAMATATEARYATVGEFQDAIRECQSHSESISLSARAESDLQDAEKRDDYETYARARFGFQEAHRLWTGNEHAREGIVTASAAYARSALRKGDYDLGATLLMPGESKHEALRAEIAAARQERDARQQRLKAAKRIGAGLVLTVFAVVTVAFFWIRAEAENARKAEAVADQKRREAVEQKQLADLKTIEANEEREKADQQRVRADQQRVRADQQRAKAETAQRAEEVARRAAEDAKKQEEYGAYIARIGLAAAKIDENAFDRAIALLNECPEYLRDWEWGRLMHLCTQDVRTFDAGQPIEAVALSPDGNRFVTGGWGGVARIWDTKSGKELVTIRTGAPYVFAVAFSPDGRHVATGPNARPGYVKIWDAARGTPGGALRGHDDAVLSVVYSRDGRRLLTGSYDETARLWDLASGESQGFQGHEWWVWSAAFSPDEKRIVTACQDGSSIVWSVETRQPGPPFLGHLGPVYAAPFSPDGKHVASAGYDRRILIWDPEKVRPFEFGAASGSQQRLPAEYASLDGHAAAVRCLQYSADGRLIASAGNDNTVRVWDVAHRKLLKTLRGHAGRVQACAFGPDPAWLLSAGHDHLAKLWNIAGYEESRVFQGLVLEGHRDAVLGADFSPDGRQIVSASRDRSAKLWDAATGKEVRQFKEGHEFLATTAAFFPDGKRLLSAAVDNTTRIWDVASGSQILALEGTGAMAAVALSRDGRFLLTGSHDKSAKLWDVESGKLLRRLEGHRSEVTAVAFSPDGRRLFTGDSHGRCRLWNTATGALEWEAEGHSRNVTAAAFLPAGDAVLTSSIDNTVAQWDVQTGRERLPWILKHPESVIGMALSPDGRRVLTSCTDKRVRLWDVAKGVQLGTLPSGDEMTNAVAFSPDGRRAVTTGVKGNLRLWDVDSLREIRFGVTPAQAWSAVFSPDGAEILTVGGNEACRWDVKTGRPGMRFSPHSSVASARFSPDGRHVVTGSWDNTARIWNTRTGRSELRLEGAHTQFVNDAAFSPDGSKVVTAGDDKTLCLWDAHTARLLQTLRGHEQRLTSAVFSPDGTRVLTTSNDKTARIWEVQTGKVLHILRGHQQAVLHGAFSPSGTRALTASQDQTAKVWDARTGKEILTLKGHSQELTTVSFSPDGRDALTGSRDGTLVLWLATPWRSGRAKP